jgi:hypothetical protein
MRNRALRIQTVVIFMSCVSALFLWDIGDAKAQSQEVTPERQSRADAIMQRRLGRITPQQRTAEAARQAEARAAAGPEAQKLDEAARMAAARTAKARVDALNAAGTENEAAAQAALQAAEAREAEARAVAAKTAESSMQTGGGTNE